MLGCQDGACACTQRWQSTGSGIWPRRTPLQPQLSLSVHSTDTLSSCMPCRAASASSARPVRTQLRTAAPAACCPHFLSSPRALLCARRPPNPGGSNGPCGAAARSTEDTLRNLDSLLGISDTQEQQEEAQPPAAASLPLPAAAGHQVGAWAARCAVLHALGLNWHTKQCWDGYLSHCARQGLSHAAWPQPVCRAALLRPAAIRLPLSRRCAGRDREARPATCHIAGQPGTPGAAGRSGCGRGVPRRGGRVGDGVVAAGGAPCWTDRQHMHGSTRAGGGGLPGGVC